MENHLALDVSTFLHNQHTLLLNAISELCTNVDGSHNKMLYKSFFSEVHSMMKILERGEIQRLKLKLSVLNNMQLDDNLIKNILSNEIIPYIAGFGLKKLLNRIDLKCLTCSNKIIYGCNLSNARINELPYNTTYIKLRDNGGLIWPSRIIVLLTGLNIKIFETFINSENMMNEYYLASSSSCTMLATLKEIIWDIVSKSCTFNAFKGECFSCQKSVKLSSVMQQPSFYLNLYFNL